MDMFKKPRPPSQHDLAIFQRYLQAVENPESVFKDMEAGRLSHESAEALRAVYPNLFSQLRDKTMEFISENPKLPYNKKLQLGVLLDIPTDESLLPQNVLGLQSMFAPSQADEQGAVRSTVAGTKQLDIASREQTDVERVSSSEE
jgi:hypothetical protein